jgi:hypothetical protein
MPQPITGRLLPARDGRFRRAAAGFLCIAALLLVVAPARGTSGAYTKTKHGDRTRGVRRLAAFPIGSCEQCHVQHDGAVPNDFALFAPADNSTCLEAGCHDGAYLWPPGNYHYSWPGDGSGWFQSAHGGTQAPFPPLDGRPVSSCVQCHDPHGTSDPAAGLYPSLTSQIEEKGCTSRPGVVDGGCHGLDPAWRPTGAKDMANVFLRPFRHDLGARTKSHSWDWSEAFPYGKESRGIDSGDFSGPRRHVECVDCHNPHRAGPGLHTPGDNAAGPALRGTWGVEPSLGGAWTIPTAFAVVDFEGGSGKEYQLCLRCHSYFAYGNDPPASTTDTAREFNPANQSFHPAISEIPTNSYTSPSAANGMTETMEFPWANGRHDRMTCSDCHTQDLPGDPAGPHGSYVQGILPGPAGERDNGFCLRCHKETVYAPLSDPDSRETGSRFDKQTAGEGSASHYKHVTEEGIGCRECHGGRQSTSGLLSRGSIHGSNLFPGLMNGTKILAYAPGSCTPTCHDREGFTSGPE